MGIERQYLKQLNEDISSKSRFALKSYAFIPSVKKLLKKYPDVPREVQEVLKSMAELLDTLPLKQDSTNDQQ